MGAGSFEPQFVFSHSVYQDPVGLDVTVTPAFPRTFQGVVQVFRRQRPPIEEKIHNSNELLLVLALPDLALDVLLELRGL